MRIRTPVRPTARIAVRICAASGLPELNSALPLSPPGAAAKRARNEFHRGRAAGGRPRWNEDHRRLEFVRTRQGQWQTQMRVREMRVRRAFPSQAGEMRVRLAFPTQSAKRVRQVTIGSLRRTAVARPTQPIVTALTPIGRLRRTAVARPTRPIIAALTPTAAMRRVRCTSRKAMAAASPRRCSSPTSRSPSAA